MLARSRLDVVVGRALGTVVMTVRGPLRKATADGLSRSLDRVLGDSPERVVVDLTEVTVLDDDGLAVLQKARSAAESHQVELQLTSRRKETRTAIEGLAGTFTVV
jgi:anti-anti-sigma factor